MNQLQEISVLLKKRIAHLEKKKQKCFDYSSTPNRCVSKVEAQIARMRKVERIAKLRTRSMESASFVDSYLDMLTEAGPKSPMGKVAVAAATVVGAHKVAKSGIRRSQCKEYKYSPYLHKRCMKGLEEAEGWKGHPKGWKQSSIKKFSKSLTGKKATEKGFFDKCVKRMQGKLDNPEGFCASIKDERHGSTFWRGKGKTPQQAGKDVKRIQNVRQEVRDLLREEEYLGVLGADSRSAAKEWNGPNLPYGDDSNRPNLIRKCMMVEGKAAKINCLRKLQDQAAMNPYYRSRIDRFVDVITDTYEPTEKPGTIPGNDFEETNVGEDTVNEPHSHLSSGSTSLAEVRKKLSGEYTSEELTEGLGSMMMCKKAKMGIKLNTKNYLNPAKESLKNCGQFKKSNPAKYEGCVEYYRKVIVTTGKAIARGQADIKKYCGK